MVVSLFHIQAALIIIQVKKLMPGAWCVWITSATLQRDEMFLLFLHLYLTFLVVKNSLSVISWTLAVWSLYFKEKKTRIIH